ncbi:hypothetical protein BDQ17DRAFT_1340825 [Cyathus striatus]|nr:hypothetical protein BDQ17DRAFT_1340825 [Cyathus striatus]
MSEIDDIFASKGKAKDILLPLPSSSQPLKSKSSTDPAKKQTKQKRKKKSDKPLQTDVVHSEISSSRKRPLPETVIDTSLPTSNAKRRKPDQTGIALKKTTDSEQDKFKDSRGSGSRRQTDEGWSIYKEDELGISNEGGDTPLCPFDCECCF